MKIRFTESQLRHIIKESENGLNPIANNDSNSVASKLMHDPNNKICWRVFYSATENSIFKNGFSSDYYGDGEGSMYGKGVYAFYKPYGAEKRVGTGGVGNKIMKCVVLGGFKDFLIFDSNIAMEYYKSDDIRVQLKHFFPDKSDEYIEQMYQDCIWAAKSEFGSVMMSKNIDERSAPMARKMFSTQRGKYKKDVLASKCRGILYNGGNDPNAFVLFNPREIIPISTTNEKKLPSIYATDFSGWTNKVTTELVEKIEHIKDYFTVGETLKAQNKITWYSEKAPEYDCLLVKLKNGRFSLYDISEERFVSERGFALAFGWQYSNVFNRIVLPIETVENSNKTFYIVKHNQRYFICKVVVKPGFERVMSLDEYDVNGLNKNDYKQQLNEDRLPNGDVVIYHRTNDKRAVNGIFNNGFKKEYFLRGVYGTGAYCALTVPDINKLKEYGPYMIRCKLKDGFKGFLIFNNDELAQSVYGNNHSIEDQLKRLIPGENYNKLKTKYAKYGDEFFKDHFLKLLGGTDGIGDLGFTNVRGVITNYYNNYYYSDKCFIVIVRDWGALVPMDYSTDNGDTFTTNNVSDSQNKYNIKDLQAKIDKYPDPKFVLGPLIANEIIVSPFEKYRDQNSIRDTQEFEEGYFLVTLKDSGKKTYFYAPKNKLISMRGFDETYGITVEEGEIVIPVIIDNKTYFIHEDNDGDFYIYKEGYEKKLKAKIDVQTYDEEFDNVD